MSTVIPIKGLFEAHIVVRDLQRSVAFYRDVLGLQVGIEQPERPTAFFWVGGRGKSMLVEGILAFAERVLPRASDLWVQASLNQRRTRT